MSLKKFIKQSINHCGWSTRDECQRSVVRVGLLRLLAHDRDLEVLEHRRVVLLAGRHLGDLGSRRAGKLYKARSRLAGW